MVSGIQLKGSEISPTIGIQNLSSRLEFADWNLEYTACNPESKTVLDSVTDYIV